jgi:hypothetical protein
METATETWGLGDLLDDSDESLLDDLAAGEEAFLALDHRPENLPALYAEEGTTRRTPSEWPAQLPVAIALGLEDIHSILSRFDISEERYELLKPVPAFRKAMAEAQRDVREQGHTFKLKCKGIAEDFLDSLYLELHNPRVGLSTKVDVFKYLTRIAGLEPQAQSAQQGGNAPQVNIQINL